MTEGVIVYRFGLCYCSVCVPKDMTIAEVEAGADRAHPTGLDHGWKKADKDFRTGETNPCDCNHGSGRLHYLLEC